MRKSFWVLALLVPFANPALAQDRQAAEHNRIMNSARRAYSVPTQPASTPTYKSPSTSPSSSSPSSSSSGSTYSSYGSSGHQMSESEAAGIMALFSPWVHYEYAPKKEVRLRIFQLSFIAGSAYFDGKSAFSSGDNEPTKVDKYGIELGYLHQITPWGLLATGNVGLQSYGKKEQTAYFRQAYIWRAGLAQWIPVTTRHLNGITLGVQAGKGYFRTNGVEGREAHTIVKAELGFVTPSLKTWRIAYGGTHLNETLGWSRDLEFGVTFSVPVEKHLKRASETTDKTE